MEPKSFFEKRLKDSKPSVLFVANEFKIKMPYARVFIPPDKNTYDKGDIYIYSDSSRIILEVKHRSFNFMNRVSVKNLFPDERLIVCNTDVFNKNAFAYVTVSKDLESMAIINVDTKEWWEPYLINDNSSRIERYIYKVHIDRVLFYSRKNKIWEEPNGCIKKV